VDKFLTLPTSDGSRRRFSENNIFLEGKELKLKEENQCKSVFFNRTLAHISHRLHFHRYQVNMPRKSMIINEIIANLIHTL